MPQEKVPPALHELYEDYMDIPRLHEFRLTTSMKSHLQVYDSAAYHRAKSGFLLYHDWSEYRVATTSRGLKGKEVYIDTNLKGCNGMTDPCLQSISTEDGDPAFPVEQTSWKGFAWSNRKVTVSIGGGRKCDFTLSSEVKQCLRIRDPQAFERYNKDAGRRHAAENWSKGELNAARSITQEVVQAMQQLGPTTPDRDAVAGQQVLNQLGYDSVTLEIDEESGIYHM